MFRGLLLLLLLSLSLFAIESNNSKVYRLVITGTKHLDKSDIAKNLGVEENSLFNFWDKENRLPQEFVKNIETTLKGYLENNGYFDAKFKVKKGTDTITVDIKEGEPVKVTSVTIKSDIDLSDIITWKKGEIFAVTKFENIKDRLNTKLLEEGYCNAELFTKAYVDLKRHSAKLVYKIKKGHICYFAKPQIVKKPKDIKEDVILSRIKYKEGERFDVRKIVQSYNSLNSLGVFTNILIKDSLIDGNKSVATKVFLDKKEKLRRYMLSLGYVSDIGLRTKASWEKRNFLGNAKKIQVATELSKKYQTLQSLLFVPAFFSYGGIYSDLYIKAGVSKEKRNAYKEKKLFAKAYLESHYGNFMLQKGIGLEILNIHLLEEYPSKIGGKFNLLYPFFDFNYDSRDSKIDPKNGIYADVYGEFGISNRGDAVTYVKYLFELRTIKSFNDLTLSAVTKVGAIHELSGHLPASKLFYGGGLFSNRAYSKNEIGYILSDKSFSPLGGKSFINLQLEANYKLYKKLYGALFFDSTIISPNEYQFNGARIDSIGFGLRYKTPVGPIKIDVGFNTHNSKDYAISIMLGQSF